MHRLKTIINDHSRRSSVEPFQLYKYNSTTSMMHPISIDLTKDDYNENHNRISINRKMLTDYDMIDKRYTKICNMIDTIEVKDLPTVRDLLYRMNAIDPIERENMNRGFKQIDYYDAPHNYCSAYMSIGRDDTTITSLMNHEISALMLLFLKKNKISLTVDYNINMIFVLCNRICKYYSKAYKIHTKFSVEQSYQPSLRYLLLQSIFDAMYQRKLKYGYRFSNEEVKRLCNIPLDKVTSFGTIKIQDDSSSSITPISIESFILSNYMKSIYGKDELSYNLNVYPMFNPNRLINELDLMFVSEEFRRVVHNTTITLQQIIMFSFIDMIESLINDKRRTLSNRIDERMFRNRRFQHSILLANELYDIYELFANHIRKLVNGVD